MDEKLWDAVQNAEVPPSTYFGQVTFDVWACVPTKGVGLVPFDSGQHKLEQKRTAIHIVVTPLPSSTATFTTERKVLAESREWAGMILPCLKTLQIEAKDLHEKYVRYEMVPTGRTWTSDSGEEKVATTFKFLGYYNTLEEAEEAAAKLYGGGNGQQAQPSNGGGERDVALKFLPALVAQSGGDVMRLATILASNDLTKERFTISSPEVIALLTQQPA